MRVGSLAGSALVLCASVVQAQTAPTMFGYLQARETYRDHVGLNADLNRVRIGLSGSIESWLTYRASVEYASGGSATTAATTALRDAYLRATAGHWAFTAGQFKTPFSREYTTSLTMVETADRATVIDSLATKRDIGLMAEVAPASWGSLAVGLFNGEGQNRPVNRDSTTMVAGRAVLHPVAPLTLGFDGASYGGDSTRYGVEAGLQHLGFEVHGEYLGQAHRGSTQTDDHGWYALASCRVTPAFQLVVRQEDYRRPAVGPQTYTHATTAGLNAERGRLRGLVNLEWRTAGSPGVRTFTVLTQAQVRW